jgi:hypothetical protein
MKNWLREWWIVGVGLGMLGIIALVVCLIVWESPQEEQAVYSAWQKVYVVPTLSFEEWRLLRRKLLLQGQYHGDGGTAAGVAAGLAAGMAARIR